MRLLLIVAAGVVLTGCATSTADTKNITSLIKTLQDDKACDRVRDIDIGAGGGQLGGEAHVGFKEHSECGAGHGLNKPSPAPIPVTVVPGGTTPP